MRIHAHQSGISYRTLLNITNLLYHTALYYIKPYYALLYNTKRYCTIPYYTHIKPNSVILYHTILYDTIQFRIIQYYYCTIRYIMTSFYNTQYRAIFVLYHTILCLSCYTISQPTIPCSTIINHITRKHTISYLYILYYAVTCSILPYRCQSYTTVLHFTHIVPNFTLLNNINLNTVT